MPRKGPNVLLANESGAGRGHIAHLAYMVKHMGKDCAYFAGLYTATNAKDLQDLDVQIFSVKGMGKTKHAMSNPGLEGYGTWGDYLFNIGLARETLVRSRLEAWIDHIQTRDISIVIAAYAPLAMLAARILKQRGRDLSLIGVSTGYGLPPPTLDSFPALLPDLAKSTRAEADVLAMLNGVLADFGASPLPKIPAIYEVDLAVPLCFPFLDPYRKWRKPEELVHPLVNVQPEMGQGGDEVYVYFSTTELDEPEVVKALCDLPMPRRGFFPAASDDMKQRLAASGVIVENGPVPIDLLAARSALFLNSAQGGVINMCSVLGRPQVGLPQHLEQTFNARRAAQQGVMELLERPMRSADTIKNAVMRCYHSATMQARARAFSTELLAQMANSGPSLTQRLAPILTKHNVKIVSQLHLQKLFTAQS
jgi:UDP:flavonoid glycosyltransferase YjiC (YdhE family)